MYTELRTVVNCFYRRAPNVVDRRGSPAPGWSLDPNFDVPEEVTPELQMSLGKPGSPISKDHLADA